MLGVHDDLRPSGELGVEVTFLQLKERSPFRNGVGSALPCLVLACAVIIVGALTLGASAAEAAAHPASHHRHFAPTDPAAIGESIVIDADTGQVLSEASADAVTHPASLTKMMT